jgi:outer membrane protein assembly factor BamD
MLGNAIRIILLLFSMTVYFIHCGSQAIRADLDADAYFEYAKGLFDKGKYYNAITEFTVVTLKFSADPIVDDAQYYLAESHFMYKEYLIAASEYQKVVEDYPESPYVEKAYYMIGLCYSNLSLRAELDQDYTAQAIRHFQNFLEYYPNSNLREKVEQEIGDLREKLSSKQLKGGNQYRAMGLYDSAVIYYDIILEKYYDTKSAELALYWKAECLYKMDRFEESLTSFSILVEKFSDSNKVDKAKSRISEIQEQLNKQAVKSEN